MSSHHSPEFVIAVFERSPFWGPELQRQFALSTVAVRECRFVGDLQSSITGSSSGLFVVDLQAGLADLLAWLDSRVKNHSSPVPIVAFGLPEVAELEWILRDAGVTAFIPGVIPGDDLARLCRRLLGLARQQVSPL